MTSGRLAGAAVATLVSLTVTPARWARADDQDLAALLSEPVETTSGKSAGSAAIAPALSVSITAEDLHRHGIRTLAEAYNFLTVGLIGQETLGEPEVGGRGLGFVGDQNKHVLLLIDGHTTNNQENGASLHGHALGLPMEMIDHIEVVLGPGSVLYGGNAMLGVVNVVTKRAKDYSGLHVIATGAYSPPLDRAHNVIAPALTRQYEEDVGREYRFGLGAGRELELRGIPVELTAQIDYYTLKGPTLQWGPQLNKGIDFGPRTPLGSWGGATRNNYYAQIPSGYLRVIAGHFEATLRLVASRISQPYQRRQDQLRAEEFDNADAATQRRSGGLELKWHRNLSNVASMLARLYGDWTTDATKATETPVFGCLDMRPDIACQRTNDGFARSVGSEVQWTFDWTARGTMTTMVGGDGRVRRVGYQNGATEVGVSNVVYSHLEDTEALGALYAQQIYRPATWLTFNGGGRWDVDDRFGHRLVPRAAVIGEPWPGGTVKAIYSEAFRAPTADEINFRDPNSSLEAQGLRPESVHSMEAVLQQRFGTQSIMFGAFSSRWTDMILRRELSDLPAQQADNGKELIQAAKRDGRLTSLVQFAYQQQNVASIDNFGFNGSYDGTMLDGRLVYALNVTASYARMNTPEGRLRIPAMPAMFGNARLSYDLSHRLPMLALATHFTERSLAEGGESAGFYPLPFAPPALDVRATATGPFPRVRGLSYRLMGNYGFGASAPFTAGPSSFSARYQAVPELIPRVRFTLMFGLQYDLDNRR